MSGYGSPDEESLHAIIMSENEVERVRQQLASQALRPSRLTCADCEEDIPQGRREAIPGVEYCVTCAPKHESIVRPRMLDKIL